MDDYKLCDCFWGCVMFFVYMFLGKVVVFGGCVFSMENKKFVKYVNFFELEIYYKSNELYGIYFVKQVIVKQDCCFFVEGYMDVILMYQLGVENVVVLFGIFFILGQIWLIYCFINNIMVFYDGDMVGIKVFIWGIDMLFEEGMNIKVCFLFDGDDLDFFVWKYNVMEFQNFIQEYEMDFICFKV